MPACLRLKTAFSMMSHYDVVSTYSDVPTLAQIFYLPTQWSIRTVRVKITKLDLCLNAFELCIVYCKLLFSGHAGYNSVSTHALEVFQLTENFWTV